MTTPAIATMGLAELRVRLEQTYTELRRAREAWVEQASAQQAAFARMAGDRDPVPVDQLTDSDGHSVLAGMLIAEAEVLTCLARMVL